MEGLLISKVSPISNSVGLHFTEKNITRKPNTATVRTNSLKESQQVTYGYTTILAHVNRWLDGIPPRAECLSCYCCVVESTRRADPSLRLVIPTLCVCVCVCVRARCLNFNNQSGQTPVKLSRNSDKEKTRVLSFQDLFKNINF